jgi:hypothetical protein
MRLLKICLLLFFCFLTNFCSNHKTYAFNKDVYRNKLSIQSVNDSTYIIKNEGKLYGKIESKIITEKSNFISNNGDSIPLDFYLINPYLNAGYFYNFKDNDYLIFESSIPGVSGIAANITEVTILDFKYNKFINQSSYSSFCGGASLLIFSKDNIFLSVFKYIGNIDEKNDMYCKTNFILINGKFQKISGSKSQIFTQKDDRLVLTNSSVDCEGINLPYVTNTR